jgi:hypothetical protein
MCTLQFNGGGDNMVSEGKGRLFRRKDGKYLIYVPLDLAEDSMFPIKTKSSIKVKIAFKIGDNKLTIENWNEPEESSE